MIKWLIILLIAVPRVIYSQIRMLFFNCKWDKHTLDYKYAVLRRTVKIVNRCLNASLDVENKDIITSPHQQGRVYVSNHYNIFEILALIELSSKPLIFVSKKENAKVPFLNAHLRAINTLLIDRKDVRQSLRVCKKAGELASEGHDIVIFAEGTRSKDGNVASFKAALPTIIHYSKTETILCCFYHSERPLKFRFFYPKEIVNIHFFNPLPYSYYLENRKEFNINTHDMIQNQLDIYKGA